MTRFKRVIVASIKLFKNTNFKILRIKKNLFLHVCKKVATSTLVGGIQLVAISVSQMNVGNILGEYFSSS